MSAPIEPITSADLARWNEACEKATPGPWYPEARYGETHNYHEGKSVEGGQANAHFCAVAREAMPRLLALAEASKRSLDALQIQLNAWRPLVEAALALDQCGWSTSNNSELYQPLQIAVRALPPEARP